jgi:hypothetical protein
VPKRAKPSWSKPSRKGVGRSWKISLNRSVGLFNYVTRLADGFGLQLHPTLLEAVETGIPLSKVSRDETENPRG